VTTYSSIYELFLASIRDYEIDKLFSMSPEYAEAYMKPFLIKAIASFNNCRKDLDARDDEEQMFHEDLNTQEKVILSNLMIVEWLTKEVNDLLQMRLHLQDTDFRTYAEVNNLKGKRENLEAAREVADKQMKQYGYAHLDWSQL
jgi:hypothetical protein